MKKIFIISLFIALLVSSCDSGDKFKSMSNLSFGMAQNEAEEKLKTEKISFVANDGIISTDKIDYLGVTWSFMRADFTENHLSKVTYRINGTDTISQQSFACLKNTISSYYPSFSVSQDSPNKFVLSNNAETISVCINSSYKTDMVLTYTEIPTQEEISRRDKIAKEREKDIDEKLQKLNEAMVEYVKCLDSDPYNLREHYVSEVTTLDNYLKSRVDMMTPKQKEWYNRLQNVKL